MAHYWIPGQLCLTKIFIVLFAAYLAAGTHDTVETHGVACFEHYGCFKPFRSAPNLPFPMSPDRINTKFVLHTSLNTSEQAINATRAGVENTSFDPQKKTKVIVHGFAPTHGDNPKWVSKMTHAILANDDVNVIIVDWVGGARVAYDQAASNTRLVGAQIAFLIRTLMAVHKCDPADFHIIGFSLGAHVSGFAGKDLLKHNADHKLGRITGLDPAKPSFDVDVAEERLDKSDAHFVDVIHTDAKTLLVVASGLGRNIGHADFYPNGGENQPGCNNWNSESSFVSAVTDMTVCDHLRAHKLFLSSISSSSECDFAAYRCPSYERFKEGKCVRCARKRSKKGSRNACNRMGYWATPPSTKKQVKYFLQTSESEPYCAKHYQVQLHWRKGPGSSKEGFRGTIYVTLHGEKGSTKEFALNDATTFHIVPGKTSRFLVSHDCSADIGNVDRVTFRWERPTCWTYFFCPDENVYLKRAKVVDASGQRRMMFFPLEMDKNRDGRKDVVEVRAGEKQELFRKSYISSRYPEKLNERAKARRRPVVVPDLTDAAPVSGASAQGRLLERVAKHKPESNRNTEPGQFLNSNQAT